MRKKKNYKGIFFIFFHTHCCQGTSDLAYTGTFLGSISCNNPNCSSVGVCKKSFSPFSKMKGSIRASTSACAKNGNARAMQNLLNKYFLLGGGRGRNLEAPGLNHIKTKQMKTCVRSFPCQRGSLGMTEVA